MLGKFADVFAHDRNAQMSWFARFGGRKSPSIATGHEQRRVDQNDLETARAQKNVSAKK